MRNNHLNQFTSNKYKFMFESCIHFPVENKTKHILVVDGKYKRRYDFLTREEILVWRRKFKEVIGEQLNTKFVAFN